MPTCRIPFLRPSLVPVEAYREHLESIDRSHVYSNYGPLVRRFESRVVAEVFQGRGACTTVNNATIGLILAIQAAKRRGRFAVMPSFTFAATPLAARWCGLEPYFIDVHHEDWCAVSASMEQALARLGNDAAILLPYATFGNPMDLSPYAKWQREGVPVVVDAAASFGSHRGGVHFGTSFPGLVVFSFHATKAFAIGEGGMVYGDAELVANVRRAANFGFDQSRESTMPGLNAKLPEVSAAIALATLDRFPNKAARRRAVHDGYVELFRASGLHSRGWRLQSLLGEVAFQFMPALAPVGCDNRAVEARLEAAGIEARRYFSPACHQVPQFASALHGDLQVTEELARRVLSLPLWEDMEMATIRKVVEALR